MKIQATSLLAAAILFARAGVCASEQKAKGLVVVVEGADAESVRDDLARGVPPGIGVEDGSELNLPLASQLLSGTLADALSNAKTRRHTLSTIHKALPQAGGALGVLLARSKRGKTGGRELHVILLVPSQLEPIVEEDITLDSGETAASKVGPLVAATLDDPSITAAPPAKARATVPTVSTSAPATKDEGITKPRAPVDANNAQITLRAGPEIGTRNFRYSDYLYGGLRGYGLPAAAMFSIGGEVFPFATTGIPFAKDVGLVGGYGEALPWDSKTRAGDQSANASWSRFYVGGRARFRVGETKTDPLVGIQGTYGEWKFLFSGNAPVVSQVPAVDYKFVRLGGDVRVPVGPVALLANAGALYVLSAGPFSDRFPRATIGGLDVLLGGAYSFLPWLEARATVAYTRVFSSVHPQPGNNYAVGGALDQYLVFSAGASAYF
jgi:hypothetical protein